MSRSRDLANLANNATGLETITVSDITDLTASAAELNKLDGVTADTAEINKLDGVTADTAELNKLDGVTASTAELNYVDGVTSAVQTQINDLGSKTVPHIIPGVLYPAVGGNDIHGTDIDTSHGSTYTYGTTHTDGRKYYYTDIKGSKPIKDPRIGAHFGSQRHKFKSLQLLEQETAFHGNNVYSIDGREWCRAVKSVSAYNSGNGNWVELTAVETATYIEVVGYFSDINVLFYTDSGRVFRTTVDGGSESSDIGTATVSSPLNSRYVDAGSVVNAGLGQTLGIHTVKIRCNGGSVLPTFGIELIAHDTSNVNEIKIPKQNVVSYGKKFEVGSDTMGDAVHPHYDPFTTMSYGGSGTTLSNLQSLIDTDTSLGMDNWKAGTSNYHRPWNGGRVVKWVNSSGAIKTSVTMMPPNAQNVSATASNSVSNAEVIAGTNTETINFDTTTIANASQLYEVAKTFHFREFGNGSANGGTGATYADVSMLSTTADDISYVMDDGTTAISANNGVINSDTLAVNGSSDSESYITFIGTGIGYYAPSASGSYNSLNDDIVAQNLPYGTHIVRNGRNSGSALNNVDVDGVEVYDDNSAIQGLEYINIFQPKKPPIPEDACVIADYMLMADYVKRTSADYGNLSKGVRLVSSSRDAFYDIPSAAGTNWASSSPNHAPTGMRFFMSSTSGAGNIKVKLPAFGTSMEIQGWNHNMNNFYVNGSSVDETDVTSGDNALKFSTQDTASTLGMNTFEVRNGVTSDGNYQCWFIHTPIHTSFHYTDGNKTNPKTGFETQFLNELVGGDRNLEQHTLICSPNGKTWDQITRDTSYLGNLKLRAKVETSWDTASQNIIFDEWRGTTAINGCTLPRFNKDFAIAYDEMICLKDGSYNITVWTYIDSNIVGGSNMVIKINDVNQAYAYANDDNNVGVIHLSITPQLKRGDRIKWHGVMDHAFSNFEITKA